MSMIGINTSIWHQTSSGGFSPSDIANLHFWLDASNGPLDSGYADASDGDPVQEWTDLSGNGQHLAALGNRPTYDASHASFNGKPVVSFDGVNDYLINTVDTIQQLGNTIFLVWQPKTGIGANADIFNGGVGNNQLFRGNGGTIDFRMWNGGYSASMTHSLDTAIYSTFLYNGVSSDYRINGTSMSPGTTVGSVSATGMVLGSNYTGSGSALIDVAEMIIYTSISNDDRDTVEAYLASKYGI